MDKGEWLVGTMTAQKFAEHLEHLRELSYQAQEQRLQFLSWCVEQQAILDEQEWRRKHPKL
ncbi:hypothetical protein ASF71_18970 [Deinococcus sp. Leaf326]|jgi:hypothetical protein|nr:hypothetical protein ASF71_18970 [Deinococcus sp. Leaf326]